MGQNGTLDLKVRPTQRHTVTCGSLKRKPFTLWLLPAPIAQSDPGVCQGLLISHRKFSPDTASMDLRNSVLPESPPNFGPGLQPHTGLP